MLWKFLISTIGQKYLMGLTGVVWSGFVLVHMLGNLLIFVSPQAYNSYGHGLTSGNLIYVIEALLIGTLILHVITGVALAIQNKKSKPRGYAKAGHRDKGSSFASRTMVYQGTIILFFIINHLITFKYGRVYETDVNGVPMRDLYRLMVEVFSQPGFVAWYCVALVVLGFHLRHGVSAIFQSFGLLHPAYQRPIYYLGWTYSIVVAAGFLAQPIYIYCCAK